MFLTVSKNTSHSSVTLGLCRHYVQSAALQSTCCELCRSDTGRWWQLGSWWWGRWFADQVIIKRWGREIITIAGWTNDTVCYLKKADNRSCSKWAPCHVWWCHRQLCLYSLRAGRQQCCFISWRPAEENCNLKLGTLSSGSKNKQTVLWDTALKECLLYLLLLTLSHCYSFIWGVFYCSPCFKQKIPD